MIYIYITNATKTLVLIVLNYSLFILFFFLLLFLISFSLYLFIFFIFLILKLCLVILEQIGLKYKSTYNNLSLTRRDVFQLFLTRSHFYSLSFLPNQKHARIPPPCSLLPFSPIHPSLPFFFPSFLPLLVSNLGHDTDYVIILLFIIIPSCLGVFGYSDSGVVPAALTQGVFNPFRCTRTFLTKN